VVVCLYILSALGRLVSGVTVAYAGMLPVILYIIHILQLGFTTCLVLRAENLDNN
jgi:hypothetical protein